MMRRRAASLISAAAFLALCAPPSHAGLPSAINVGSVRPTSSGIVNSKYRNGDDGSSSILLWSTIPNYSKLSGASFSVDVCAGFLTQIGSPAAAITNVGASFPTGWTLSGTNNCTLGYSGTGTGSALIILQATRLTVSVNSNEFRVEATAPPAADTTAPPAPTNLVVTNGVGSSTATFDAIADVFEADGDTCQGAVAYDVTHSVAGTTSYSSPSAGLCKQFALTNVGALSPTPTAVQTGGNVLITGAGDIDGPDDLVGFWNASVAGTAFATVKVNAITTSNNFGKAGIMVRNVGNVANEPYYGCYIYKNADGTLHAQARRRQTPGATATSPTAVTISALPVWLRLTEVLASVFTCEYSTDQNTFTALESNYSLPMNSTKPWGLFTTATTGSGGATAIGDLQDYNLNNLARISVTVSTASAGTIKVRTKDGVPNVGSYGATQPSAPQAPPAVQVKFHPGHYVNFGILSNSSKEAPTLSKMNGLCADSNIKGYKITMPWGRLEGATLGDYSAGFALIDSYLNAAAGCGKRIMIQVQDRIFGGAYSSNPGVSGLSNFFPAYLLSSTYGTCCSGTTVGGVITAPTGTTWSGSAIAVALLDTQPVMDRLIALSAAYAARYDTNANFEMWMQEETALPAAPGLSASGYVTQRIRALQADSASWPHTMERLNANYGGTDPTLKTYIDACKALPNCVVGGPDPEIPPDVPTRLITANQVFRGARCTGCTVHDYRGELAWVAEQQTLGMGSPSYTSYTPTQLDGFHRATMHNSYMIWIYNDYTGGTAQRWSTGELPFITSISGAVFSTSCPANVPSCAP